MGLLDTCVLIDLARVDDAHLPVRSRISTVTLAELGIGIALAETPTELALRSERMSEVEHAFDALPLCSAAARRFTSMVKLVVAAGRNPKPRKFDLMIAAIASVNDLPLYTSNVADFTGLEPVLTVVPVPVS
ncbi:type II toxin-antitoxin system VapC family toxin [Nocardia mangyaensis]|uniref:type II toxin-antitoxin system VapC family toxin n=1 Tax=Nocardia mangyaensis TaxID=2213200 RepID=UPI002674C0A1|nr:type II toxin-antitoxin system VapC family toxin [Nocardia mangyaensis]MDO3647377.1 type II toxin-antitoxin system VapC family toxin [Nocardia mangyaensis]